MTLVARERPILFSGSMVRAILEGRKTQTRRVVKGSDRFPLIQNFRPWIVDGEQQSRDSGIPLWISRSSIGLCQEWGCPFGKPRDRLWIRETFFAYGENLIHYKADQDTDIALLAKESGLWNSPLRMPRWASRLTLEICSVRVERVQDISEDDAKAEGIVRAVLSNTRTHAPTAKGAFEDLWDGINQKRGYGWNSNPWVWVIEFR